MDLQFFKFKWVLISCHSLSIFLSRSFTPSSSIYAGWDGKGVLQRNGEREEEIRKRLVKGFSSKVGFSLQNSRSALGQIKARHNFGHKTIRQTTKSMRQGFVQRVKDKDAKTVSCLSGIIRLNCYFVSFHDKWLLNPCE